MHKKFMLLDVLFKLILIQVIINAHESPRSVVYPPGAGNKVQLIVGIGVPASNLPTVQSVTWGYVIKTNYVLPTNISQYNYSHSSPSSRSYMKRSTKSGITRWHFYASIVDVLNRAGLHGEECLKRSICETAKTNFSQSDIIGELLHIILLPSITNDFETEYYRAELTGRSSKSDCREIFKKCPSSLLDLFSKISEETGHGHAQSLLFM